MQPSVRILWPTYSHINEQLIGKKNVKKKLYNFPFVSKL